MPETKKYEVELTAFKIGDPTFQIGLISLNDTILNLHIEVELTVNETILVLDTTIPQLPQGETALLMGSFSYPNDIPNEAVVGELHLTTAVSGDVFSLTTAEGVTEFSSINDNTFATEDTPIIANSSLPSASVIENGNILAIQCIDEQGNHVFLTASPKNESISLLPIFNPYINPGSQWELLSGPHSNSFYLKCLASGTNTFLYGDTNSGTLSLTTQSHDHKKLWSFHHNTSSGTNVYDIECYQTGPYRHIQGNTSTGQVDLGSNYSTTDKTVNWYLTKLN